MFISNRRRDVDASAAPAGAWLFPTLLVSACVVGLRVWFRMIKHKHTLQVE